MTHQCFLSARSLYLVVWNTTKGEAGVNALGPWLHNIQVRVDGGGEWESGERRGEEVTNFNPLTTGYMFLFNAHPIFLYIHVCTYPLLPQARAPGSPVVIVGTHCDLMRGDAEKDRKKVAMNNLIYEKYLVGKGTPLGGEVVLIRLSNDKVLAALTGVPCDCRAQKSLHTPFSHTQDAVLSKCGSLDFPKSLM